MTIDRTVHQSDHELDEARELSLEPTRPPANIEGYVIQNFLGRGSYGEVWSALDQKTGKRVAIKFYSQRSSVDVQQLADEVKKLVVLSADRYVVQLLDVGWNATPPYYVMDYIEHGSIEDLIKKHGALPVEEAVELFEEIAVGLMHLHNKGILHCDLKPGNVLLDQDGKPRVADFGQSRLATDATSALGTLYYMAPEQADLDAVPDARWDVYGLGALLYSMLTGRPPYWSKTLTEKIEQEGELRNRLKLYRRSMYASPKPNTHKTIPGVDRSLGELIDRCIAAKPKNRFASVESVVAAIRDREVRRRRRPLIILGILGPLLLLGTMGLFGWYAFQQATQDTSKAIVLKAEESNQFAARLAARSAAEQIDEYFRVVKRLAAEPEFIEAFTAFDRDKELESKRRLLADPQDGSTDSLRVDLSNEAIRKALEVFLSRRLVDKDNIYPPAASWFINDRFGNQVASVFEGMSADEPFSLESTLGKNYAQRTYFTGLDVDLEQVDSDIDQRTIIQQPHLSASFLSGMTNRYKVAFSAPIIVDGETRGVVAATVNLGNLIDFDNNPEHYVILFDGRPGQKTTGRILEHPLFNEILDSGTRSKLPAELALLTVDIDAVRKKGDGELRTYRDPVGATQSGTAYDVESIIAVAAVLQQTLLRPDGPIPQPAAPAVSDATNGEADDYDPFTDDAGTGLYVLAFEDYQSVVLPVQWLSGRLGRLGILAALVLASVAFGLWMLVSRLFNDPGFRMFGSGRVSSDSPTLKNLETNATSSNDSTSTSS